MSRNIKNSSSGKTTITAITTLFVALVAGGILFARPAAAQASGTSAKPVQFAPVTFTSTNILQTGATTATLNCVLPELSFTIQDAKDFRIVCSTPDGDLTYNLESTINSQTFCQIQVSVIYNPRGFSTLQLVDLNLGKTKTLAISYSDEQVAIRLEPSTDTVGNQHEPVSADLKIQGQMIDASNNSTLYTTIQQPYSK